MKYWVILLYIIVCMLYAMMPHLFLLNVVIGCLVYPVHPAMHSQWPMFCPPCHARQWTMFCPLCHVQSLANVLSTLPCTSVANVLSTLSCTVSGQCSMFWSLQSRHHSEHTKIKINKKQSKDIYSWQIYSSSFN